MKRNFEKFITISLAVVSAIFVMFLLVMILSTDVAVEANNGVVQALFIVFTLFFLALSSLNIYSAFCSTEKVNQILLFKTKNSAKKASVGVVRKIAKKAVADIEGIKIGSIHLFVDSNNDVTFKAAVKVRAAEGSEFKAAILLERISDALETEFMEILGLEFKEVELKLVSAKYNNSPDASKAAPQAKQSAEQTGTAEEVDRQYKQADEEPELAEETEEETDDSAGESEEK